MTFVIILMIILGITVGLLVPFLPYEYTKYTAIAIMACFDSVMGAFNAHLKKKFDMKVFVSGFFVNSVLSIILTLIGETLDVDIFLAAIFVFVFRIYNNFSSIRRELIFMYDNKVQQKKLKEEELNNKV